MAEFIMKDIVSKNGMADRIYIESKATSTEEEGNPVYPPARAELIRHGIKLEPHRARQVTRSDYSSFDYLIVMDSFNLRNLQRITGPDTEGKVYRLLDFTSRQGDIADPWYSNNFSLTYEQIEKGCLALFERIKGQSD